MDSSQEVDRAGKTPFGTAIRSTLYSARSLCHQRLVFLLRAFSILLIFSCAALAQVQERTLSERLNNPDPNLENHNFEKSYYGGRQYYTDSKTNLRSFYFVNKTNSKSFVTKGFNGVTPFWAGDVKFNAKSARTKTDRVIPNVGKAYSTKEVDVNSARESSKAFGSRDFPFVKKTELRGKSQESLDARYKSEPMTIDQVRELLNKNK
jgi:hypothetical protein